MNEKYVEERVRLYTEKKLLIMKLIVFGSGADASFT